MKASFTARYALCVFTAIAFLGGCGKNAAVGVPSAARSAAQENTSVKGRTFFYTGAPQSFRVPAQVYAINVVMRGASGQQVCKGPIGRGGRVVALIPVLPHQKLWVSVGGQGHGPLGGFNGGGNAGGKSGSAFGGGGASDVRVAPARLSDRILVAGGSGGGGYPGFYTFSCDGAPGYGGGLVGGSGGDGFDYYAQGGDGGTGGTQNAGGTGGAGGAPSSSGHGYPGKDGHLGIGGTGGKPVRDSGAGGGGGGGYYGGGGGGSGSAGPSSSEWSGGGGGGGGSSYAEPSAEHVRFWQNWKNATGDGLVVFSWQ